MRASANQKLFGRATEEHCNLPENVPGQLLPFPDDLALAAQPGCLPLVRNDSTVFALPAVVNPRTLLIMVRLCALSRSSSGFERLGRLPRISGSDRKAELF